MPPRPPEFGIEGVQSGYTQACASPQLKYRPAASFTSLAADEMAPSLKKYFRLALGAKLSTWRLLLSVIQRRRSLEHVHVVARISWIRVMCWNLRECRPHPTYLLASVANVFACLSKMHAKVPVCFNFK